MQERIKNICSKEDGKCDIVLYQICKDVYYHNELNKEQLMYIFFIGKEQQYDIIVLMNLCRT